MSDRKLSVSQKAGENICQAIAGSAGPVPAAPIGMATHTHTHTHKSTNKHKQETKVFHSLVSAMATKGATHPTTETAHVLPSSTMTLESGEECTGRYNWELPADLSATWAEGATHPVHDTSDDSNREYCAMPRAHV